MTVNPTIDVGQIISGSFLFLMTVLSWLIKNKIGSFELRLDRVEMRSNELSADIQKLIGIYQGRNWTGHDRRKEEDNGN